MIRVPNTTRERGVMYQRNDMVIPVQIRFSAKNIIGVIAALAAMDMAVKMSTRGLHKLIRRLDRVEAEQK
jgi:hypothetical protein